MIKNILFDFDGVILDSMPIRDWGFAKLFESYSSEDVERLVSYHKENGGLSRYVKIRYFFNDILGQKITEEQVYSWANQFSTIVKDRLCDRDLLIESTNYFIQKNCKRFNMHIVSGSDENELQEICERLDIARFFLSIQGSPTPKTDLVAGIMAGCEYKKSETILVGDSINDYDAAIKNNVLFCGFNNIALKETGNYYINEVNTYDDVFSV